MRGNSSLQNGIPVRSVGDWPPTVWSKHDPEPFGGPEEAPARRRPFGAQAPRESTANQWKLAFLPLFRGQGAPPAPRSGGALISPCARSLLCHAAAARSGKHARKTAASQRFGHCGRKLPRLPKSSTPRAERCTPSSCHPPGETRAYGESGSHGVQLTLVPPFHRIAVAMSPRRGNGYRIRRPPTLRIALTLWRLP